MRNSQLPRDHKFVRYLSWTILMIFVFVTFTWLWSGVPQLKYDDQVFRSLDAMFTAVTARSNSKLNDCGHRLETLHDEGRIPEAAWNRISKCRELAHRGEWDTAARSLYQLIESQRGNP